MKTGDKNILGIVAKTNAGRLRRLNKDRHIITNDITGLDWRLPLGPYDNSGSGSVMAIADGIGSSDAGELASYIAIDSVKKNFQSLKDILTKDHDISNILKIAIILSHHAILHHAESHPETKGMVTTLIIGWFLNEKLYVSRCGNSRCYHYRPGVGLKNLTKDHSTLETLLDEGKITKAEAFYHPQNNTIIQRLGHPENSPQAEIILADLVKDDIIMMCSDGLNFMLIDEEIEEIIKSNSSDINSCADILIEKANAAGGIDNMTIILTKVFESNNTASPSSDIITKTKERISNKKKISTIKNNKSVLGVILLFLLISAGLTPYLISLNNSKKHISPSNITKDTIHNKGNTGKQDIKEKINSRHPYQVIKIRNQHDSADNHESMQIDFTELNKLKRITANNNDKVLQKGCFMRAGIIGVTNKEEQ